MALITLTPATGLQVIVLLSILAGIGVAAAHMLPWPSSPMPSSGVNCRPTSGTRASSIAW